MCLTSGGITGKDHRLKFIEPNKDKAQADIHPLFYLLQERMAELYSNCKDDNMTTFFRCFSLIAI
jgi:hypothetical protein